MRRRAVAGHAEQASDEGIVLVGFLEVFERATKPGEGLSGYSFLLARLWRKALQG
jgi:hypothetical protein